MKSLPLTEIIPIGTRFERLVVIGKGIGKGKLEMICDCGKIAYVRPRKLLNHETLSCGCRRWKHGNRRRSGQTREYSTWASMIARCNNKEDFLYGGRKITVCNRWKDFRNFLLDMGKKPKGLTLDRIDNSKGYYLENCRWATPKQQARNTRRNRIIECKGEKKTLSEWAEKSPVKLQTIHKRLKLGWLPEKAIFYPLRAHRTPAALWESNICL